MPGHVGLLAFGQPWMTDAHWADLMTACELGIRLSSKDDPIHELSLHGRALITNEASDVDEVRRVVGEVVQWVAQQPNGRIHAAVTQRLKEFDEQARLLKTGR